MIWTNADATLDSNILYSWSKMLRDQKVISFLGWSSRIVYWKKFVLFYAWTRNWQKLNCRRLQNMLLFFEFPIPKEHTTKGQPLRAVPLSVLKSPAMRIAFLLGIVDWLRMAWKESLNSSWDWPCAQREKALSNKTSALTKSTNMDVWVVGTSNQHFIRGS